VVSAVQVFKPPRVTYYPPTTRIDSARLCA
jgi:hypothetical protein